MFSVPVTAVSRLAIRPRVSVYVPAGRSNRVVPARGIRSENCLAQTAVVSHTVASIGDWRSGYGIIKAVHRKGGIRNRHQHRRRNFALMDRQDSRPPVYVDANRQSVDGRARVWLDRNLSGSKRLRSGRHVGVRNHRHLAVARGEPHDVVSAVGRNSRAEKHGSLARGKSANARERIYNLPRSWESGQRTPGEALHEAPWPAGLR